MLILLAFFIGKVYICGANFIGKVLPSFPLIESGVKNLLKP